MFLALSLISANWLVAVLSMLALRLLLLRLLKEEAQLSPRFSDGCRDYMQRTGRLLPQVRA